MSTRKPKIAPENVEYKTAQQVAAEAGVNRTTLTRMHGRGDIAECKVWGAKPQPHRLYSKDEVAAVIRAVNKNKQGLAPKGVVFL